jgi:hypothetical protein
MRLSNQLHEDFARLIAEGLNPTGAYRQLKPNSRQPSVLGSRLWNRQDIRIRISEIAEEAANERNLPVERKLKLLEGQIRGEIPTKVIDRGDGQVEEIYDMLAALTTHSRICGDFLTKKTANTGPTLKLNFNILGRNEDLTPEMEAEYQRLRS